MKKKLNIIISVSIVILGAIATFKLYSQKTNLNENDVKLSTSCEGAKVDPEEIVDSCAEGKDCIPSIDNPIFVTSEEANEWLNDEEIIFGVNHNGVQKAYPQKIMNWHEVVNDIFNNEPVVVTFCPLCNTGVSFIPKVNGQYVEFGVSGKLRKSDLIMYDRLEGNLWQQATGQAILGPAAQRDEELEWVSTTTAKWKQWKEKYPDTLVLSKETGFDRDYSVYPYGDYESNNQKFIVPTDYKDVPGIAAKDIVYGVNFGDTQIAYPEEYITEGTLLDNSDGRNIQITKNSACELTVIDLNNNQKYDYLRSFWFAWSSFYPDTQVYSPTDL